MIKYKITLEPMGAFFFGGERSFSISTKDEKGNYLDPEDEWSSYIVESNMFPQQTALLGMLRFTLLKNSTCFNLSKNKIENKELAKEIIGEHGFKVTNSKNKYGVIDSISTCYIEHDNDILIPTPLDYGLNISFNNSVTANYNSKEVKIPFIEDKNSKDGDKRYSGKTDRVSGLVNLNNGNYTSYDKVFRKDPRVGINRDIETGKTDDGALFKQIFYRLEKEYKFCFYATLTDDTVVPKDITIIELGGDSSKFAIKFNKLENREKEPDNFDKVVKCCKDKSSVILLADTLVNNEDYIFAISENIPFKFLVSTIDHTTQYSRMPRDKDKRYSIDYLHKSKRYSLYKRGSVFYFDEDSNLDIKIKAEAFAKAIKDNACFNQIGYNKCVIK